MTALDSALALAAAGLRVFPLKPNAKTPLTEHGCLDAALDEAQIRAWWERWPGANIGVATGQGFFVLDVDPRHGGNESLAALEREHGALPPTREALTGGGGRHLHFTAPDGTEIRNSAGKLGAGLDVKSAGGYVVAPRSIHPSGALYVWAEGRGLDCPLALAPSWLLERLAAPAGAAKVARPAGEWAALLRGPIADGQRNNALVHVAGMLFRELPAAVALELLLAFNDARCQPPLDDGEVERVADRIARRELLRRIGRGR